MNQPLAAGATHTVLNQAAPPLGWNAFSDDRLLVAIAGKFARGLRHQIIGTSLCLWQQKA